MWSGWMYPYANASLSGRCRLLREKNFAQMGECLASNMVRCRQAAVWLSLSASRPITNAASASGKNRNQTSGKNKRCSWCLSCNQDETDEAASLIHHADPKDSAVDAGRCRPVGLLHRALQLQHCLAALASCGAEINGCLRSSWWTLKKSKSPNDVKPRACGGCRAGKRTGESTAIFSLANKWSPWFAGSLLADKVYESHSCIVHFATW
jgi:hypothetical protein